LSTIKRIRLTAQERREIIEQAAVEVFAERGYRGASMGEIASRSNVSVPVVYDHFESKLELYRRLLERTRNELLELWGTHLFGDDPAEVRIRRSIEAWATYVESNRDATRMYFTGASGDASAEAVHRDIQAQARVALGVVLGQILGPRDQEQLEMAGEIIRAGLVGLVLWWYDHRHVSRELVVQTAMEMLWMGYLSNAE
jgi:AcrR family transcriptional regulator